MASKTAKELGEELAYPTLPLTNREPTFGMTKREVFAAMAMQGILSDPKITNAASFQIAGAAVDVADALLRELAKEADDGR